jgi:hypothetical protein
MTIHGSDKFNNCFFQTLLAGDLDYNDVINFFDLADLNRDGIVNALDFSLMNKNWQASGD